VGSAGAVYVTNIANGVPRVSVIDSNAASPQVEFSLRVGNSPRGVAVSPDGSRVYVANYDDDTLSVIDTSTVAALPGAPGNAGGTTGAAGTGGAGSAGAYTVKLVTDTIPGAGLGLGNGPWGVAVFDLRPFTTNYLADTVTGSFANGSTVTTTLGEGDGPIGIAGSPTKLYVANSNDDTVTVIGDGISDIAVGANPRAVAYAGTRVYVTNYLSDSVSVIDDANAAFIGAFAVGDGPIGVAGNQSGSRVYVANSLGGTVSVINTATNVVTVIPGVSGRPSYLAVNPAGTRVYVTDSLDNRIAVINTTNNSITYISVGTSQAGIAFNPF
jgi:YVTN family beta-propeller protein